MRFPRVRYSLRGLMALVAIAAVALLFFPKPTPPLAPPPLPAKPDFRLVKIIQRNPDGSLKAITESVFDLNLPYYERTVTQWDERSNKRGAVGYRKLLESLEASKVEYRITKPKAFTGNGTPIY